MTVEVHILVENRHECPAAQAHKMREGRRGMGARYYILLGGCLLKMIKMLAAYFGSMRKIMQLRRE